MKETKLRNWTLAERIGFRFLFAFLVLSFFPFPSGLVNPYWLGGIFDNFWEIVVPWFSRIFLNIEVAHVNNGSGDTTYDYLRILCIILISVLVTFIWSFVDRRRGDYRVLYSWARIWLRYALALCMLTFGAVKVLMVQFESPSYGRLTERVGDLSPMALLWTFMGFSAFYTSFTGIVEVTAGLLLFFRRTRTLGALIVAGAMTNVLMLNLSYDVPVKLGAFQVLFLALVLLAPELGRLADFFFFNRPAQPADLGPHLTGKNLRRWSLVVKTFLIGSLLIYLAWDTHQTYKQHLAARSDFPKPPEGWYRVVSIRKDNNEVPPLTPDDFRWRTFSLRDGYVGLRSVDGTLNRFKAEGDPNQGPVVLYPVDEKRELIKDAPAAGSLELSFADGGGQAHIKGTFHGHDVEAVLQRENPADFPLMSRGFRWISESPYFR